MKALFTPAKTVDQVVSVFNKAVADLRDIEAKQTDRASELLAEHNLARGEASRAGQIAAKLSDLVYGGGQ